MKKLSCPFCGGNLQVWTRSGGWEVMCVNGNEKCFLKRCTISTNFWSEEEVWEYWNLRYNQEED